MLLALTDSDLQLFQASVVTASWRCSRVLLNMLFFSEDMSETPEPVSLQRKSSTHEAVESLDGDEGNVLGPHALQNQARQRI